MYLGDIAGIDLAVNREARLVNRKSYRNDRLSKAAFLRAPAHPQNIFFVKFKLISKIFQKFIAFQISLYFLLRKRLITQPKRGFSCVPDYLPSDVIIRRFKPSIRTVEEGDLNLPLSLLQAALDGVLNQTLPVIVHKVQSSVKIILNHIVPRTIQEVTFGVACAEVGLRIDKF